MSILSDTYAAYLLALAETPAKHAIVAHVDAYIMAANAQKARIRELEASIAALKNDRLTWAMACECACDACEVLSSRIAHLPTANREGEHD